MKIHLFKRKKNGQYDERDITYSELKKQVREARDNEYPWHISPRSLAEKDETLWLSIEEES